MNSNSLQLLGIGTPKIFSLIFENGKMAHAEHVYLF